MNRQMPKREGASPNAVAHVKRIKHKLRLPALEPIRVSWLAVHHFDEISGGSHGPALKTFHPSSGAKLWLDEQTRSQIDVFRNGKRETYTKALLRLAAA